MKVYIIFECEGDYEDYNEWIDSVWADKEKAEIKLKYLEYIKQMEKEYQDAHAEELQMIG